MAALPPIRRDPRNQFIGRALIPNQLPDCILLQA
jgi:hypothetical protein